MGRDQRPLLNFSAVAFSGKGKRGAASRGPVWALRLTGRPLGNGVFVGLLAGVSQLPSDLNSHEMYPLYVWNKGTMYGKFCCGERAASYEIISFVHFSIKSRVKKWRKVVSDHFSSFSCDWNEALFPEVLNVDTSPSSIQYFTIKKSQKLFCGTVICFFLSRPFIYLITL